MGNFPDLDNGKDGSKHEREQQRFCGAALGGSAGLCDDCPAAGRGEPALINGALWNQMQVFTRTPHAAQCLSSSQSACVS